MTPKPTNETGNDQTSIVLTANFTYPSTTDGSALFSKAKDDKVTNTFLWDYYYQGVTGGHDQKDMNGDKYLKYYSDSRTYDPYAMLTNGIPYLIGLPGITYYEFDLSGKWEALTTGNTKPAILRKQVITFASVPGTTIQASDSEMGGSTATYDNKSYIFKPNYLNIPELETGKHAFLLNSDGDATWRTRLQQRLTSMPSVPTSWQQLRPAPARLPAALSSRAMVQICLIRDKMPMTRVRSTYMPASTRLWSPRR